jgi:hypothetical protein
MEDKGGIHEGRARKERRRGANSSWMVKGKEKDKPEKDRVEGRKRGDKKKRGAS